ncbi:HlyD family efflux transporter periplasmic adaptor subunit [Echinicola soli]|uniref:HlyD family efflux transporter periplasmic adaptor subunit n=1 Tax=Echinicola soli TaxID=2591634 RepID=A0A514CNI7_9BACT|nr:efflux RND transporter periplasmic adaptor subunit [Echinicola soli]QDH81385.1 HlyD family efflux transporter periplasmic adaptor subunit [Echinicola soli]
MKKNLLFVAVGSVVAILVLYFIFSPTASGDGADIIVPVEKGKFTVEIATTGELKALRSVMIMGPTRARDFRVNQITIERMVDEGTVVKKGDFIASLDKSELFGKLSDGQNNLDSEVAQYEQAKLDTALTLRQERDNILNLEYNVEQKKLVLEQSQYEPPATIKQNEYDLEKAERDLDQARQNYKIKFNQALAKMAERSARLRKEEREFQAMNDLLEEFTITAPQDGMVIYRTNWDGNKIAEGSQISAWNPVVATLPDLTEMQSITYVNEVEIRKVKVGQAVKIGLDAFPEKEFTGKVTRVANVGQQRPNSDAKVFEVEILVNESDPVMRPAMTTSNTIIAQELEEAIHVPLEAVHVQNDSINYVYLNNGVKQEVKLGMSNYDEATIELGLEEGDKVYLSIPNWGESQSVKLLEELNGKRNLKEEEAVQEEMPKQPVPGGPAGGKPAAGEAKAGKKASNS